MIHSVIMAGGSGTRFWPLSRETHPKQFLKISGRDSLLQQTFSRLQPLVPPERTHIVANPHMGEQCLSQLPAFQKENLILEPMAKNTAPAIGLAAFRLLKQDPEAVMIVLPSDHYIANPPSFLNILKIASEAALLDYLVTLGIHPTRPETGYGYIKKAAEKIPLKESGDVFLVKAFREKPDSATAQSYLEEGGYYWNSGMFVWKASVLLKEMEQHMPSLWEKLARMDRLSGDEQAEREKIFSSITPESIDYGIMEKSEKAALIPADIQWFDVGSFSTLTEINETDKEGNWITGNIHGLENQGSLLYGSDRLVAAIGLKDMIVVDTADATLVCPKDRAQDVKKIAEKLKQERLPEFMEQQKEIHEWGTVSTLDAGSHFRVRKIEIEPGMGLERSPGDIFDRRWTVLSGTAQITIGEELQKISAGDNLFIPKETKHELKNEEKETLVVLEVQIGDD